MIKNTPPVNTELVFIGSANWDIYANEEGHLWSVPKPQHTDCKSSYYGTRDHIKKLMANGWFSSAPTEAGLELLAGLQSRLLPSGGSFLAFH